MRVAVIGISIEIMLASPVPTTRRELQVVLADQMRDLDLWMVRGVLARLAEDDDIEAVPLRWATALPGGTLTAEAYAEEKAEALRLLAAARPLDGVVVVNHGALEVEGLGRDADTDYVVAIREAVGPDLPIAVALDLHGDMTPGLLAAGTVFSVLRTAPHRDDRETGHRAADQLVRVIREDLRPKRAAVRLPLLIPGETAVTSERPAGPLYGSLPGYDAVPGMMEANILVGFAWNDLPWTAATALAVAESDAALAQEQAVRLAEAIWAERAEFVLRMETAEVAEGLTLACACPERPVYLSDAGDNTTAGASGELTFVLQAALDDPACEDVVVAGITAPETVRRLTEARVGAEVEIELGAEHVSRPSTARRVLARVEALGDALDLSGFQPYRSREAAWVRARIGKVIATFHSQAIGITTLHHLRAMGIDPLAHKAYVVKLGYLHPQLEDIGARHILLLSDGTSQLDMTRLPWTQLRRPAWPLDRDFVWSAWAELYGDPA